MYAPHIFTSFDQKAYSDMLAIERCCKENVNASRLQLCFTDPETVYPKCKREWCQFLSLSIRKRLILSPLPCPFCRSFIHSLIRSFVRSFINFHSLSIECNIWENRKVSIRRSHPGACQKKMYAYLNTLRTRMLPFIKGSYKIARFVVTRFLIKLSKSMNTDTINDCRICFNFLMPSDLLDMRRNSFEGKFVECCDLLYYFGINRIT